jgi:hypothetical protein
MVFGSIEPWAEAALLAAGAAHVQTVEYASIISEHAQISAITPTLLGQAYIIGNERLSADFIFSYSSFEHDGLGRYGDPMSPSADFESIARVHCLLKDDGLFFLGMPSGPDALVWNAHRIYGKYRMSVILGNWDVVDLIGNQWGFTDTEKAYHYHNQPMWVLKKKKLQQQQKQSSDDDSIVVEPVS